MLFTKQRLLQWLLNRVSQRAVDMTLCAAPVERQFPVALVPIGKEPRRINLVADIVCVIDGPVSENTSQ